MAIQLDGLLRCGAPRNYKQSKKRQQPLGVRQHLPGEEAAGQCGEVVVLGRTGGAMDTVSVFYGRER